MNHNNVDIQTDKKEQVNNIDAATTESSSSHPPPVSTRSHRSSTPPSILPSPFLSDRKKNKMNKLIRQQKRAREREQAEFLSLQDEVNLGVESGHYEVSTISQSRHAHNRYLHNLANKDSNKTQQFYKTNLEAFRPFLTELKIHELTELPSLPAPPPLPPLTASPPYILNGEMRDYQLAGVNWMLNMHQNKVAGILADEMGLGKTLQVIAFLSYLYFQLDIKGPHLIIAPLSVLSTWQQEWQRWSPCIRVVRYHGPASERKRLQQEEAAMGKFDVLLTSYEMISNDEDFFRYKFVWYYTIVDEGVRLKNEKSMQSQAMHAIARYNTLLLTGTPVNNTAHELWAMLNYLHPTLFTSSASFDNCFDLSTATIDTAQLKLAYQLLQPLMLRRMKAELEMKLPPKHETKVFVHLSEFQRVWYKRILTRDLEMLESHSQTADSQHARWKKLMSMLMQLRKVVDHPFLFHEAEDEWIAEQQQQFSTHNHTHHLSPSSPLNSDQLIARGLIETSGKMLILDKLLVKLKSEGHRVLLFSCFSRMLNILEDYCISKGWPYLRLDGSTNRVRRSTDINRFNAPNSPFFIYLISTRAGGLGINLSTADVVIHYDSDFNPQCDLQAQARAHRIGQTKSVEVYRFLTENTVEERLIQRAEKKMLLDVLVNQQKANAINPNLLTLTSDAEVEQHIDANNNVQDISKGDILSMLKWGCDRIWKTSGNVEDEDIEAVLDRSRQKTESLKVETSHTTPSASVSDHTAASNSMKIEEDDELKQGLSELKALLSNTNAGHKETKIFDNAHYTTKDFKFNKERSLHLYDNQNFKAVKPALRRKNRRNNNNGHGDGDDESAASNELDSKPAVSSSVFQPKRVRSDLDLDIHAGLIVEGKRDRKNRIVEIKTSRKRKFPMLRIDRDMLDEEELHLIASNRHIEFRTAQRRSIANMSAAEIQAYHEQYIYSWSRKNQTSRLIEKRINEFDSSDSEAEAILLYLHRERKDRSHVLSKLKHRQENAEASDEDASSTDDSTNQQRDKKTSTLMRNQYQHEDHCHLCKVGGDLLCCAYCPRTMHYECSGLKTIPINYACPQHSCAICNRSANNAGGMLFRCIVCPCSYCDTHIPPEYSIRLYDQCAELTACGYIQPSNAFFITCSIECSDYYQAYLDGKFQNAQEGENENVYPIPDTTNMNFQDVINKQQAPPHSIAVQSSFLPEIKPHVCACLFPKKKAEKLYCVCRTPFDENLSYIQCDLCNCWFHLRCVGIAEDTSRDELEMMEWICRSCKIKEKQQQSKAADKFAISSDSDDERQHNNKPNRHSKRLIAAHDTPLIMRVRVHKQENGQPITATLISIGNANASNTTPARSTTNTTPKPKKSKSTSSSTKKAAKHTAFTSPAAAVAVAVQLNGTDTTPAATTSSIAPTSTLSVSSPNAHVQNTNVHSPTSGAIKIKPESFVPTYSQNGNIVITKSTPSVSLSSAFPPQPSTPPTTSAIIAATTAVATAISSTPTIQYSNNNNSVPILSAKSNKYANQQTVNFIDAVLNAAKIVSQLETNK